MRLRVITGIILFTISLMQTSSSADELKGQIQETSGTKPRINRPPPGPELPLTSGVQQDMAHKQTLTTSVEAPNFQTIKHGVVDLSNWNPWPVRLSSNHMSGYGEALQPGGFMLRPHFQQPFLRGDGGDLAAVERAWKGSATSVNLSGRTVNVRVTLALCRPGGAQVQNWEMLMGELKEDRDRGNTWRQWQDQVCADVASQAGLLSEFPGSGAIHVRITPHGADPSTRPRRLNNVSSAVEALSQLVNTMSQNERLQLPAQTNVSEAHIMIIVNTQSPYIGIPGSDPRGH